MLCQMGLGFGYIFGSLAPDILDEMGWSRATCSFTRLPQLAVMSLTSPLVGLLTIRLGARRVLAVSGLIIAVALLGIAAMQRPLHYYGLMMLLGAGLTGVGDITVGHTVSQWVARGRGLALGVVYIGSNLGGLLLVPAAAVLAHRFDWRQSLLAMAALAGLAIVPAALFLVRDRGELEPVTEDDARACGSELTDLDLRQALRTRSFWILGFALFCFFFYFLSMLEHLVLFLTDQGMSRNEAVGYYTGAIGLGIWSKLGLGLIADRIPERTSLLLDYALLTLSSLLLLLLLLLPSEQLTWIFAASFGISYAARDVVYPLVVTRCFGLTCMAQIYGALMVALVLGAGGSFFAAWVHDARGSYTLAFQVFAGMNVVALIALCFTRDERRAFADQA